MKIFLFDFVGCIEGTNRCTTS